MSSPEPFDVLVVGSGASGLAAGVSAARAGARVAVATKTTAQANNSVDQFRLVHVSAAKDES